MPNAPDPTERLLAVLTAYLAEGGPLTFSETPHRGFYPYDDPHRTITIRVDARTYDDLHDRLFRGY